MFVVANENKRMVEASFVENVTFHPLLMIWMSTPATMNHIVNKYLYLPLNMRSMLKTKIKPNPNDSYHKLS